jgi:putative SOS response-associated peptidase YedK
MEAGAAAAEEKTPKAEPGGDAVMVRIEWVLWGKRALRSIAPIRRRRRRLSGLLPERPHQIVPDATVDSSRSQAGALPCRLCQDPKGGRKPINAKCETVHKLPTFREAYRRGRCVVPVDGFFEWKAVKGKPKQPYAIAIKDGSPFGLGGPWENWKDPTSGEWIRTFAIIATDANELVAAIHDRMPLIIAPGDYGRWLGDEPNPYDLMRPFPAEPMQIWPISTRVNKPENDDSSILEPINLSAA